MKKWYRIVGVVILMADMQVQAVAQSQEVQQLLLNVEKLAQFKQILQDMYDGYKTLEAGYNKVNAIASGNYQLHQVFLDGLLAVSPEVKNYYKVVLIIQDQVQLVKEYKGSLKLFRDCDQFSSSELGYFEKVYKGLLDESVSNLDALLTVVTAGKVRMNDDERLQSIDELHTSMNGKLLFLRHFNQGAHLLAIQRVKEQQEIGKLRKLHAIE